MRTGSAEPPPSPLAPPTPVIVAAVRPATKTWKPPAANRRATAAPRPSSGPTPMTIALGVSELGDIAISSALEAQRGGSYLVESSFNQIMLLVLDSWKAGQL